MSDQIDIFTQDMSITSPTAPNQRKMSRRRLAVSQPYIVVFYSLILFVLLLSRPESAVESSRSLVGWTLLLALTGVVTHFVAHRSANWLRIDTCFLVSYSIVSFHFAALWYFNALPENLESRLLAYITVHASVVVWLGTVGLYAWLIGFCLYSNKSASPKRQPKQVTRWMPTVYAFFVLLAAFFIIVPSGYLTGQIYKTGLLDTGATVSGVAGYVLHLLTTAALACVACLVYHMAGNTTKWRRQITSNKTLFVLIAVAVYIALFLRAGERGQVLALVGAMSMAISASRKPVGIWLFTSIILVGGLFFSLVAVYRASAWEHMEQWSAWSLVPNMGSSPATPYIGIEAMGHTEPFWGALWVSDLLSVVPFLKGLVFSALNLPAHYLGSAAFLSVEYYGPNPRSGVGTSIVIDIFMNFGAYGVVFFMLAYGYTCRAFQVFLSREYGFFRFVLATVFAGYVVYSARGSIFVSAQQLVWTFLFVWAFCKLRPARPKAVTDFVFQR